MDACSLPGDGSFVSFVELVRCRAAKSPTQPALAFLMDGEEEEVRWTYRQLDDAARSIAAHLQQLNSSGRRALLLYSPGLEFTSAFLGCLYAGIVAIPAYLPRPNRPLDTLESIVADAEPSIILTTNDLLPDLTRRFQDHPILSRSCWLTTDRVDPALADRWEPPEIAPDTLASLQYTSGSTATPKGVMLTHRNLIHNSEQIYRAFEHSASSRGVIWLPPYHDMGLIGGILQPLYAGFPTVLMSPVHVMQRPIRWLKAISRYQATTSGGPNFIYDLCVQKIDVAKCGDLDLGSWDIAFCGAEPVRRETMERFAKKFEPFGFRKNALFPCYGLAEATLLVSGGPKPAYPQVQSLDKNHLRLGDAKPADPDSKNAAHVVSCGVAATEQKVLIVEPESLTRANRRGSGRSGLVVPVWLTVTGIETMKRERRSRLDLSMGSRGTFCERVILDSWQTVSCT